MQYYSAGLGEQYLGFWEKQNEVNCSWAFSTVERDTVQCVEDWVCYCGGGGRGSYEPSLARASVYHFRLLDRFLLKTSQLLHI